MKSSWIFSLGASLGLGALLAMPAWVEGARRPRPATPEELTNVFLSPEYSQWLVGAIARIATPEEVKAYLAVRDDASAERSIEEFWRRRDDGRGWPRRGPRELFEQRAEEADRLFSEGAYPGRRSDRGTIHVLYGPPEETRFEIARRPTADVVEVWVYPKGADEGLDGRRPDRYYRFFKRDGLTVFYTGPTLRPGESPAPRRVPG